MRILVCDGTYFLYRIFFTSGWALGDSGGLTGGCYGVLKSIHAALERLNDITGVVVVWDGAKSKRRLELYPEYKANRHAQKSEINYDEFELQMQLLEESLPLLGVKSIRFPDREGDDVIYWATRCAGEAVIASDDRDMLLMLAPTVDVYRPAKDEYYTWGRFVELNGYPPDKYIYSKAITGDSSDNIKGVKGAGEKTAREFVETLATLQPEVARANAGIHHSKRMRAIYEQWDVVERNIQLMDFRYEPTDPDQIQHINNTLYADRSVDRDAFFEFCRRHKFASMLNDGWLSPFMKACRK